MTLVIDIDNHDGELSVEDIRLLKRMGMQGAIVGLQYPDPTRYPAGVAHQQIEALLDAQVPIVACYAESQHIRDTWTNVKQFKAYIPQIFQACEEDHVDRTWIDSSLNFIDALGLAKRAGIYTAPWWWKGKPFEHWFGDRDLWVAQYDSAPDVDIFTSFGDWTRCTIKQWNGDAQAQRMLVSVGRLHVDLNVTRTW